MAENIVAMPAAIWLYNAQSIGIEVVTATLRVVMLAPSDTRVG